MKPLADQLSAFYSYIKQKGHKPEPITSNFLQSDPEQDMDGTDTNIKFRPSVDEIMRQAKGKWVWGEPEMVEDKDGNPVPKTTKGPVLSIGDLKFSDGDKTEKAMARVGDGAVVKVDRKMPRGAMLGTKEVSTEAGPSASITIGNAVFCERMSVEPRDYIPSKKLDKPKDGKKCTIEEAIANTPKMPPVTYCPPGVASGTAQFSDQFIGMKIGSTGKGGSPHWVDLYTAGVDWVNERKAHDEMTMEDKAVFAAALEASRLADISPGGSTRGAEKRGKRLLIDASKNYAINLQKFGS